jgi:hypothetical protein
MSPTFSLGRNFPPKISRHIRNFESVATLSLTRDILPMCRGSIQYVGLLRFFAGKVRASGVLEAAGAFFWSLFHL